MADEETEQNEKQEQKTQEEAQGKPDKIKEKAEGDKGQLLQWIILAVAVILLAVAGFFLGNTLGNIPQTAQARTEEETTAETQAAPQAKPDLMTEDPAKAAGKGWYYDLDPVATNLSDPGSTRYVRAVLTLEISPEVDQAKGAEFLDDRKPVIANILNIYFAGLTIEDINSDKDMRRIQYELTEIFNETLYDDDKPLIRQILFKEFGLQ